MPAAIGEKESKPPANENKNQNKTKKIGMNVLFFAQNSL